MSYIIVIFIIGALILIHEFGHFLMARWMRIPVARFSIGYGTKLWGFRRKSTEYRLSIIPLGGYVLPEVRDESEFFQLPIYKRIVFTLGGPTANILLAVFLFAILNVATSGLSFTAIAITPFLQTWRQFSQIVMAIPLLFSHPDEMSGVVGIVILGAGFAGLNPLRMLSFSILLSLNFAVFNFLPFPPLDGGKLILYILEKIHPKLLRIHVPLAIAGFILLIGLMLYVTALDIGRYFAGIPLYYIA